jgi:tetratricopeptide (TPR) repeat protein
MKKHFLLLPILLSFGCKKYLDAKPDEHLVLPKDNIENLQLLLDDTYTMNGNVPASSEVGSDNFQLSDQQWLNLKQRSESAANLYIWGKNLFNDNDFNDYTLSYQCVFNANVVLDAVDLIEGADVTQKNAVKGEALFFRSFTFYNLLQEFAKTYQPGSAATDPGIVLKLSADVTEKVQRASVKESFEQVINDLKLALALLPGSVQFNTRPTKAAALGLLARVYLTAGEYNQAMTYAKQYLATSPALIDYNDLSGAVSYPIPMYNAEVTFNAKLSSITSFATSFARISDELYGLYDINDLRRNIFFKNGGPGNITFRGSYYGQRSPFAGIATDEVYLILAECYARNEDVANAMLNLNKLLIKRWRLGTFVPVDASNKAEALKQIILERRKELVFRNLRWSDLRRFNLEADYKQTLIRKVNGQLYQLNPGGGGYVYPLPLKVIELGGLVQN